MTADQAHPDHRGGRLEAYLAAYAERWGRRPYDVPEYVPDLEAPMSLSLVLPVAVPYAEVVNMNGREHWGPKSRRAAALRNRGRLAYRMAGSPRMAAAVCLVHVYYPDRRKRDVANLAPTVKALVDGMVSAGLLPDDDDTHLTGPHLEHAPEDVTPPAALWDLPLRSKPFLFVLTFTTPGQP